MLIFTLFPERYIPSSLNGILLYAKFILPSLFPFFVLTKILTSMNIIAKLSNKLSGITQRLFNTGGISSYIFIMGLISGYPVSSSIIADCYKNGLLTKEECERTFAFTSTSGPIFIIGTVGFSMLQNKTIGFFLLLVHIISSILTGLCFRNYHLKQTKPKQVIRQQSNPDFVLSECMYGSIKSILIIGGYIALFFILCDILRDFGVLNIISKPLEWFFTMFNIQIEYINGLTSGIVELTRGIQSISSHVLTKTSFVIISGLISWSGISIILQSHSFLSKIKIKARFLLLVKTVQSLISIIIATIISFIIF
ncbi:MAG: hypothetical protein RR334_00325 [Clostridia bacterium]